MKISAVTTDQIIVVDGVLARISKIGGYHMTNGEWAIYYDTNKGYGEIEYLDNRPNQLLDKETFDSKYAWLLEEHQRYLDHKAAQEIALNEQQTTVDASDPSRTTDSH